MKRSGTCASHAFSPELPPELVTEVLLWLVNPSWANRLHCLARRYRCLACMMCYQLPGPLGVSLKCYSCYLPLEGDVRRDHQHLGSATYVSYEFSTSRVATSRCGAAAGYSYDALRDRVLCLNCTGQFDSDDDFIDDRDSSFDEEYYDAYYGDYDGDYHYRD